MEEYWLGSLIATHIFLIAGWLLVIVVSCFVWRRQTRRARQTAERNRARRERELAEAGRRIRAELCREQVMKRDASADRPALPAIRIRPGNRGMEISMEQFEKLFG